jgi:SSS family solute:Na+ symporter
VTRAMIKILTISLGVNPLVAVAICFVITVAYSVAAGMWAVLWTDLVQFIIKMTAVIVLAIYAVAKVGGIDALKAGLAQHFGSADAALAVLPLDLGHGTSYAWLPGVTLAWFLFVQWWAAWYPGAEPGGGGYVAQRIFSARSEKDGVLAVLSFQVAHYALRPWPWIITGLACILLYPNGVTVAGVPGDHEATYVQAFVDLLPTPWRGFMMAGFAAAYMSTVATQLNWGASYLVNDVYKRFLNRDATEKHYVSVSRAATVVLFLLSIFVTWQIGSVGKAWKLLIGLGAAGTGLVYILRWYWWRINAWSEIAAMVASFVTYVAGTEIAPHFFPDPKTLTAAQQVGLANRIDSTVLLITVAVSTATWLIATFATAPERAEVLEAFYKRVRPGGPGWATVSTNLGFGREPIPGGITAFFNWVAGVVAVYASLFGIGKVIFGDTALGVGLLAVAALAFAWIARSFRTERPSPEPVGRTAEAYAGD